MSGDGLGVSGVAGNSAMEPLSDYGTDQLYDPSSGQLIDVPWYVSTDPTTDSISQGDTASPGVTPVLGETSAIAKAIGQVAGDVISAARGAPYWQYPGTRAGVSGGASPYPAGRVPPGASRTGQATILGGGVLTLAGIGLAVYLAAKFL